MLIGALALLLDTFLCCFLGYDGWRGPLFYDDTFFCWIRLGLWLQLCKVLLCLVIRTYVCPLPVSAFSFCVMVPVHV